MAFSPEVEAILARYSAPDVGGFNPSSGTGSSASAAESESPGLLKSTLLGIKQGATFEFGDEIEAGLRSAFSDRKYTDIRDEARARDKAAQEAHPWGFGLGNVIGSIGTGVATGGIGGAAAKLGTRGMAALAATEGAISGAGASEADLTKGDVGGIAKDAAISGAVGGVLGAGLSKALGHYADTSVTRRAKHLTEDIGEGAIPTAKRRLGAVVAPESGSTLAVDVLDGDAAFSKAMKQGQSEARVVAKERLGELGKQTHPLYDKIDEGAGKIPLESLLGHMDGAIKDADVPGGSAIYKALKDARDEFAESWERRGGGQVPAKEARGWVTRLLKNSTSSMGSLSETERKVVKDKVHEVAHDFLRGHLDDVAAGHPDLAGPVSEILGLNKKLRVYSAAEEALGKAVSRKNWSPQNARELLSSSGLPLAAGIIGAGADVLTGGASILATKGAMIAGKKLNRAATFALSKLVRASRAGDAGKQLALDAVKAGVPLATVQGILGAGRNTPGWAKDLVSDTAESAYDTVTE